MNTTSEKESSYESKYNSLIERLERFAEYIDKAIDAEYDKEPLSAMDALRKSSYCLALERDKNGIYNILADREFNDAGEF